MAPRIMMLLLAAAMTTAATGAERSMECSLNGVWDSTAEKCTCDAPWKGTTCAVMDILPTKAGSLPSYGFKPNVSSWGGNIIKNDQGSYDLYVSEMTNGCGLINWGSNSRIIHATSNSVDGAFDFKEVVLPVWAHNAAPVRAPASHIACPGCYFLFHIGDGTSTTSGKKCDGHNVSAVTPVAPLIGTDTSSLLHVSKGPDGPWTPMPSIPGHGCNNPAPAFAKNGTLFVLCSSSALFRTEDPTNATAWLEVTSLNLNDSPWTTGVGEYIRIEDPYLWQDANSYWHILVHRYDYRDGWPPNPNQTEPVLVSGHVYSQDGIHWNYSMGPQPFDPKVCFDDGTCQNFSTFERPHLIFDDKGVPTHVIHGASPVWDQYGDHHPCEVCPARPGSEHSCVVCKSSTDYSWTYTLTQPLATSSTVEQQ